jgi:hypothetical protein
MSIFRFQSVNYNKCLIKQYICCFYMVVMALLSSCQNTTQSSIKEPSFYYWKSVFKLSFSERQALKSCKAHILYIKFFDIDLVNQKPSPKATIQWQETSLPDSLVIVPTVFITNKTLMALHTPTEIGQLTNNLFKLLKVKYAQISTKPLTEIQIDCDWSPSTQQRYFDLLHYLKKQLPKSCQLSCTIRLHQIKFPEKTGVPPVDRGMLMCYNMADWKNIGVKNSIFDIAILEQYIDRLDSYPLPLDVAMPLFRWVVVYRAGRYLQLLNQIDEEQLTKCSFLKNASQNRFVVAQDTTWNGLRFRIGDLLRAESVPFDKLTKGSSIILSKIRTQNSRFAFYHLDSLTISSYTHAQLYQLSH